MAQSHGESLDDDRLRRLLDVGRALVSEFALDAILDRVLEVARELTDARYAAIGVLDEKGAGLERFVTAGIDAEAKERIGDLPRGRGVLGVLIDNPQPLRLTDVGRHPKSFGFPPGHPPMTTFLGVPIRVRDEVYGNLYLTEKLSGEFSETDEEAIGVLADWAAIAIDNARAYEREYQRRREVEQVMASLEATIDISRALGGETDQDRVLELIVKRARALVDARTVLILLSDEAQEALMISAAAGEVNPELLGRSVPIEGSVSGAVFRDRQARRLTDVTAAMHFVMADAIDANTGLFIPLAYRGRSLGVLAAFDREGGEEFRDEDERLLESFAASAAIAVATAQTVAEEGLRRSIDASERERRRWARELHDETLQELAGLRVLLAGARGGANDDGVIGDALEQIDLSITGLRSLITELRPATLDEYGLAAAAEALVDRLRAASGVHITTDIALAWEDGLAEARHEDEIESTLYRLVQEGLNNALRHGEPERVDVSIQEGEHDVVVEIRDDGRGFDPAERREGFGLLGMRERVALVGGTLEIQSSMGAGTLVSARVPGRRRPIDAEAASRA
jgi:signal transduction histidine kinase